MSNGRSHIAFQEESNTGSPFGLVQIQANKLEKTCSTLAFKLLSLQGFTIV